METNSHITTLHQDAIDSAKMRYDAVRDAVPEAVTDFDGYEFDNYEGLGPKIIPLEVFKLAVDTGKNSVLANSAPCASGNEHCDLVDMGPSIIAPLMIAYLSDIGVISTRSCTRFFTAARWAPTWSRRLYQYFNEGDHDQAPKYISNQRDGFFINGKLGLEVRAYRWRRGLPWSENAIMGSEDCPRRQPQQSRR
ncbi:uncharacterized protein MAM_06109 [Metarhizium album ARSEF 1941]|uniref:Uncharacterized protein n=1 Tax=Metarhizium album (strain ARSEF 1941) TaxID=1081103 RepID=A0A0B2WQU3_METAS|nr:uncharacterized protein MAM_06109 [Metarhizium album ARSEF 1941]KHN96004.1 hypothetical protein MAM_06109 [Metarhizium album ARSEF 1941]